MSDHFEYGAQPLSEYQKSALSHRIRKSQRLDNPPLLMSDDIFQFKEAGKLPLPPEQARQLIEIVGDHVRSTGKVLPQITAAHVAEIGSLDLGRLQTIFALLKDRGLVTGSAGNQFDGTLCIHNLDLTLEGWEEYEQLKSGLRPGHYGFLAMQYNEPELERLAASVIKPRVLELLGYEVIDLRDEARAGVIDNIMREKIRDSAFILADLTHDNYGAYWEAGYAEGLGKPVIYICEQSKFENAKTHFDTNHCTTVTWSEDDEAGFTENLIATLRRSLGLF